jgi:S1-C subfamily serine protease
MTPNGSATANTVAYLGVRAGAVDNTGIKVLELLTNSPAGAAGVLVGDIIIAVDGHPISGLLPASAATATVAPDQVAPLVTAFFQLIATHHPGEVIQLTVQRGGQTMTMAVTLGAIAAQ